MQLAYFYHRNHLHKFSKHRDFHFFELAVWLHTLARSLIAVFVPILLLKSGYTISNILVFYLIYNCIDVPLNFGVKKLLEKIGARRVLILGTISTIVFFGLLGILPPGNWPLLILLAAIAAAYDTLFWIAHIYLFIEANREGLDTGKTVGILESIRILASIIGPLVGAVILVFFGKVLLVFASVAIFALSIIPLFRMRHVRDLPKENKLTFSQIFSSPSERRDYVTLAILSVHSEVDGVLWPLFIFTIFGTIASVTVIPILVSISTAMFSYFAGKLTKKYGVKMMIVGSLVIACAWLLRVSFQDVSVYYATIMLVGIFSLLVAIPLDVSIISHGLKIGSLTTATYRNAASMILRIPLYLFLIFLVEVFRVSFVIASGSLFLIVFMLISWNSRSLKNKKI